MKVLVADDDAVSRTILVHILTGWGYEVEAVADGEAALTAVLTRPPQIAILDWVMPGRDGPDICRAVRDRGDSRYVYMLLVTAMSRKEDLVKGLEAGADDYLAKPYDLPELRARLATGRRIVTLESELVAAREEMRVRATRDPLTGAWNRGMVLEGLDRELARGQRERRPVSVILCDVDHFKRVNDTHGHLTGDAVLREAAARLSDGVIRPYDLFGRYGGEEFLAVLPGCGPGDALGLAERLRARLAAGPVTRGGAAIPITASFGVAASEPHRPLDAPTLLHAADEALYQAKRLGRNRVEAWRG